MFRGKESSNRIELSWLVQELLNFGVFGFLRLLGVGGWVDGGGGWLGGAPHTHACACTCMHAHVCVVNMVISCKWLPPLDLGKFRWFPMMSYVRACAWVCVCTWVECTLLLSPIPIHPPPTPQGGTPGIIQNSIALELIKIFQFCLKFEICGDSPTHGWVYNLVGGWVDGWGQVKSLKVWKLLTESR